MLVRCERQEGSDGGMRAGVGVGRPGEGCRGGLEDERKHET